MKELFKELLFNHHILVRDDDDTDVKDEDSFCALIGLANRFGIRITEGEKLASPNMVKDAAFFLGEYVPEPFYRGFPESVRRLTSNQLLFDQLYHYTKTYGNGWFDKPGHSVAEEIFDRMEYSESAKAKDFVILTEPAADTRIHDILKDLLGISRPLNPSQRAVVLEGFNVYGFEILPEKMPCKKTAVELLYATKNLLFAVYLNAADVIKLVEYIQYTAYGSDKLNKLNLCNQDRKFISAVLDMLLTPARINHMDTGSLYEKRKIWCGLLHHIHYKPKTTAAAALIGAMRNKTVRNPSAWSEFERLMKVDRGMAARRLVFRKGTGALVRNLNYILSRCENEHETEEVLACLK